MLGLNDTKESLMIRSTMFRTLASGLAAGSLLVLAACGSDAKVSSSPQTPVTTAPSGSGNTAAPGTSSGNSSMGTNPASGSAGDCLKFAQQWASAIGGAASGQATGASVFDALVKLVPDKLKADAQLLATTYSKYFAILKQYNGDIGKAMADPNVQKSISDLSSPEVSAAQKKITDYFDAQCPKG
jgi:hypothetical protein